ISIYRPGNPLACYLLLPCRWDSLFLGVLGAWFVRKESRSSHGTGEGWFLYTFLGLLSCAVAVLLHRQSATTSPIMLESGYTVLASFYLSLLFVSIRNPLIAWLCRFSILRSLGTISYGVYVFHQGVALVLKMSVFNSYATMTVGQRCLVNTAALTLTILLARL